MTKTNYAYKNLDNHTAKAFGKDLGISTKVSVNIAKKLRGMKTNKAVAYLERVAKLTQAVPFTRFTDGVGHRKGKMASGRFPVKAATEIKAVLKSAISNAANLNMSEDLVIESIIANKAANRFHFGRQRRRAMKSTHIEIVLREVEETAKPKSKATEKKVEAPKVEKPIVAEKPKVETKVESKSESVKTESEKPKAEKQSADEVRK